MSDETDKEPELLDGVKILLDRMEMFPEEFVPDNYGGASKWGSVLQFGWEGVLTNEEKKLLEEGIKKATRAVFSQRVAAQMLSTEEAMLQPVRGTKPKNTTGVVDKYYITTSTTNLSIGPTITGTGKVSLKDKYGADVILYDHEYKYYLKQDQRRRETYLEWIKRGRK